MQHKQRKLIEKLAGQKAARANGPTLPQTVCRATRAHCAGLSAARGEPAPNSAENRSLSSRSPKRHCSHSLVALVCPFWLPKGTWKAVKSSKKPSSLLGQHSLVGFHTVAAHCVRLCQGGANAKANLWPRPHLARSASPAPAELQWPTATSSPLPLRHSRWTSSLRADQKAHKKPTGRPTKRPLKIQLRWHRAANLLQAGGLAF